MSAGPLVPQVFATVNSFLREDPAARKRRLRVFTYTIVPLSPDSGVLEWVEDTMPFGSFLTDRAGRPGAHRRYFPKDWYVCTLLYVLKWIVAGGLRAVGHKTPY